MSARHPGRSVGEATIPLAQEGPMHPELLHEIAHTHNAEARELAACRRAARQAPPHGKRPTLRIACFAFRRGVRVA